MDLNNFLGSLPQANQPQNEVDLEIDDQYERCCSDDCCNLSEFSINFTKSPLVLGCIERGAVREGDQRAGILQNATACLCSCKWSLTAKQ
jgi:hypothetical protein